MNYYYNDFHAETSKKVAYAEIPEIVGDMSFEELEETTIEELNSELMDFSFTNEPLYV